MLVQDETIHTLMELGLTGLQSKVYLTLAAMEKADGKTLWKSSGVARQDIYRILDELQNKGLIEKILTTPMQYKAIPLQEGLSILLRRKADQYKETEIKVDYLKQRLQKIKKKIIPTQQQFVLVPGREAHERRINQAFKSLQKSIDTLMTINCTALEPNVKTKSKQVSETLPPLLRKAIMRGITSRHILNAPNGLETIPDRIIWKSKGSYELRFIEHAAPTSLCIIDEKEVFFTTTPTINPNDSDALWTNNSNIVDVAKAYFETLWRSREKDNPINKPFTIATH